MTYSITATPAQWPGNNGESPAHVVVDIPTTETITKITRLDSYGEHELWPDAASLQFDNYPGPGVTVMPEENKIANPSFENGVTGWTDTFSGTVSSLTSTQWGWKLGGYIGQVISDGTSPWAGAKTDNVPVVPGEWLLARAWIGNDSDSGSQVVWSRLKLRVGGVEETTEYENHPFYGGRLESIIFQVPPGQTTAYIEPQLHTGDSGVNLNNGKRMWLDAVSLESFATESAALAADALPFFDGWRVTDDAAPFETVTYTAHTATGSKSVSVDNVRPEMPVLLTTLTGTAQWVIAEQITTYAGNRESGAIEHDTGGEYPLITWGARKLRTGTVGIYCTSHAEAVLVEDVLTDHLALIRQHVPGLDLTMSVVRTTVTPFEGQGLRTRWAVTAEFTEVAQSILRRF